MSPEQTSSSATLARLRAEIADDRVAMGRRAGDLDEAARRMAQTPQDVAAAALAAWALHGWYSALEALLERIARQLDAELPAGERWHRDLLSQCTVDVPGVRPAVLPRSLRPDLEALLAFRHFARHAYGIDLDPARLAIEMKRLRAVAPAIAIALDAFDRFVDAAIASVVAG